MKFDA